MRRLHYVDLLRGLAAMVVLICHYRWFFARFPGDWRTDVALPGYRVLWPIYDHGELAVPLFWVLSGFVFAMAYGRYGKGLSVLEFWWRRFSRLYPLHFATLLLVAALQAASWRTTGQWQVYGNNDVPHFIQHLFLASNWFTMESSFNGPIWSVSIEEVIYFVFLLYLKKLGLSLWSLALAFAFFILERLTFNPVALCGALFFTGVSIAILPKPPVRVVLLGFVGLAALTLFVPSHALLIYAGTPLILWLFIGFDDSFRLPVQLRWIGAITYSVYLLHMPVLIALRMTVGAVPLPLFAVLVISVAVPTFYLFEMPAQRWIRSRSIRAPAGGKARYSAAS